ncbi:ABC transporter ATP-binding protein [Pelagibius marinus]|uniref:ABC transporter ATP-binding protein n=1 Tax=Pelagibius marinus TaxID=2762760 RepID=UPI0029CAA266|nr:oligopeptide/dipeptide ABC transporter ATP-binding protein [Pelagibius marinus]
MNAPHPTETAGSPVARRRILEARDVSKRFVKRLDLAGKIARRLGSSIREETVHAVDGVSLSVGEGEVLGLVGESGCGKSTFGRMVAGILPPSEGTLSFDGKPIWNGGRVTARETALAVQMIFQDPFASLDPRMRVQDIVGEAPVVHGMVPRKEIGDYVAEVMLRVGLDPDFRRRYPHQFSGGQRQRIGIARALAVKPRFLVCDEAIAALDVSIQAQVINLFMDLRADLDLTYLFISHDLSVVEHIADRVVIMYLGRVVEIATTEDIFDDPNHPYTQALLSEVPRIELRRRDYQPVKGEIPSPLDPPSGCHFHPRCPHATERCRAERPALREIAPGRLSACHLND